MMLKPSLGHDCIMIELSSMTCECCYLLISHHRDLDIPFVHDLGISLGHELASS